MLKKTRLLKKYGSLTLVAALSINTLVALPTQVEATNNKVMIDIKVNLDDIYKDQASISSWALEDIKKATEKGYIKGNNGELRPKSNITRAEFTKIIVEVLELEINKSDENDFKDIERSNWFYPYATAASKAGIVSGDGSKFRPEDKITREQMAAILVRAFNLPYTLPQTNMKDMDKVSSWAKLEVETVIGTGLMQGSESYFNPKSQATREMAATVAIRGMEHIDSDGDTDIPTREDIDLTNNIKRTANYMKEKVTNPLVATIGGEWTVFGLARSNSSVSDSYYDKYYSNLENTLIEKEGKLHPVKYTEYDRVILALTSMGRDVRDVAGYNLLEPLADFDQLVRQGINGPIFTLLALDSNNYKLPQMPDLTRQTSRQDLIDFILAREIESGGWHLRQASDISDPDVTAMAIQALTPYYTSNNKVKKAVDRGVKYLSKVQGLDGGYSSMDANNLESVSQVVVALSGLGIDPHNDKRFVKNNTSVVDALLSYQASSGGFYHIKSSGQSEDVNLMSTEQAMCAMEAYDRFVNDKNRLYDMTDLGK